MNKVKIDSQDLQIGMYVAELDRPWLETPFLFQGFVITSQGDINELERCCNYVFIDEERSNYEKRMPFSSQAIRGGASSKSREKYQRPAHKVSVEEEFVEAKKIRTKTEQLVSTLFHHVSGGGDLGIDQAKSIVGDIMESLERSPDALLLLGSIRSHDNEAEAHAINCSILSLTLGRYMQLSHEILEELALAALLHDVGEVKLPVNLVRKAQKTREETEQVMQHTSLGAEILLNSKDIPNSVVDVALSHHEQVDGKGYPRKLKGDEISLYSRIVAIVDTYDRLTTSRDEKTIPATEALRYLYLYRDKFFDASLTEIFIKCLGIYPVGSLVELLTGEVGIVISVQPGELLHPKLLLVRNRKKEPVSQPKIISLAFFAKKDPEKYAVKQVLPPDAYGVDMRSYLLSEVMAQQ